ncbi:MAG: hypothetical protein ACI9LU_002483 [Polaribacter sp.]|jgi:hypothetical protein
MSHIISLFSNVRTQQWMLSVVLYSGTRKISVTLAAVDQIQSEPCSSFHRVNSIYTVKLQLVWYTSAMDKNQKRIIVYGGNGFVGTHVAEQLIAQGGSVTCASRSGQRPAHLANTAWADNVQWIKGDAGNPEPGLLSDFEVMISTIGSPPLPTFSQSAYNKQLLINGTCNVNAIERAGESGIKRLVLVGAKMPKILQRDGFAYAKGKRIALEAAQTFSSLSDEHRAIVIQPGAIFGTRYTPSGTKIPLGLIMGPLSKVLGSQLVAVEKLAKRIVDSSLSPSSNLSAFELIKHAQI